MKKGKRSKAKANKRRLTDALLRNLKGKDQTYLIWDDRQSGFGIAITPKGTISFKCIYYVRGRLRWFTLDKFPAISLKDARELAQKIRAMAVLGVDAQQEKRTHDSLKRYGDKFQDVAERYVQRHAKQKNKSWRQADNLMKKYVLPKLGSHPIKEITKRDIKNIFDRLGIDKGKPVLANQVLSATGAVLRWAVDEEFIEQNPARGISRNKVKAETRFLTDAELRLIWVLMNEPLRLILVTGQRPGEVACMRWQDIDLNEKLWTLPGAPNGSWPGTKNARTHEVPLSPQAISILYELEPRENGMVFDGKIPRITLWKQLGLEKFRPHHLRATASTGMDELGIHPKHISRVLNHTIPGVTESYIRHSHREQKRMALEAWGNHLDSILTGTPVPSSVVDIRSAR